jgi:uncharacterized membrane protein
MSESNAQSVDQAAVPAEPALFSALLTPHRSLSGVGFLAVMGVIAGISFVGGVMFFIVGAWPVIGFLGLDVALVYWAFRANYLAAAAYEEVTVTPSELRVKKVSARGEVAEWSLNPVWVRVERETHPEYGLLRLFLVSHGRKLAVAGFLGPAERDTFAKALSEAIGEAKRGPTRAI